MNSRFKSEMDFIEFKLELSRRLAEHSIRGVDDSGLVKAAVMVLIMNKGEQSCVLLTKRTNRVRTHKGEVSLPGGAYDDGDGDLLFTALRETHEEVGVHPDDVEVLGRFDEFESMYGFHVSTFVGALTCPYEFIINEDEIEEYFEVPLDIFIDRRYSSHDSVEFKGRTYPLYSYTYKSFNIWGLTARILTDLGMLISQE